jgi:hypothetical protein
MYLDVDVGVVEAQSKTTRTISPPVNSNRCG